MEKAAVLIVGAGVVGLAIGARLSHTYKDVIIIDKNNSFGEETSSRNSEVIHAGIYYPKNSLKAKLCVSGKEKLYEYCQRRHIPFNRLGKLVVAHGDVEEAFLEKTIKIASDNGVDDLRWLNQKQLSIISPQLSATAALLSPSTGIIDVHSYMQSLLAEAEQNNALFIAQTKLLKVEQTAQGLLVTIDSQGDISQLICQHLINSTGLHSEQVTKSIVGMPSICIPTLHWCRGHYFSYHGKSPFDQLIYPIPNENGLGIHASLDMGGQLKFGPDTQYIDELSYDFPTDLKQKFVQQIQRYFPALDPDKLQPAYCGIRPKLQGINDPFKDFVIQDEAQHAIKGLVNLFGIDSPGLTSSLAIAEYVEKLLK